MATKHGPGWRARWCDEHGSRHSETFRFKRDADAYERQKKAEIEQIRRGLRVGPLPDHSFDELADSWMENRASQKRSRDHDASIIRAHLRPTFGNLLVRHIDVTAVNKFVLSRANLNKKTVANLLTLLISMLYYARDLGWLNVTPRIRKRRVPLFARDFHYLRNDDEIARFLASARVEGELVFALYCMAIYTGLRAGELAALSWPAIDFDRRLITVQASFDGPTKAEDVRYVPILDPLLPILRAWKLKCPGSLLFPNELGTMLGKSARVYQEVLHRVLARAGFPSVHRPGRAGHYVVFHDLRHTFATLWVSNGGDIFKLQKILGHKSMQMTMRYAHLVPDAFTQDYGRLRTVVRPTGHLRLVACK